MKCPECQNEVAKMYPVKGHLLCQTCMQIANATDATTRKPDQPPQPLPPVSVPANHPSVAKRAMKLSTRPTPDPVRRRKKITLRKVTLQRGPNGELLGATTGPIAEMTDYLQSQYMTKLPPRVYVIELNEEQEAAIHQLVSTGLHGTTAERAIIRILDRAFITAL